ncbi:MAG TPA: 16S rRNA (guanine(527)-N(7))-methyltransferase RsmG [Terriglobales bacterium]|jgi:16S rRNA (guanine527-N7)-methyltransferase
MDTGRIADLLAPFLGGPSLSPKQLEHISIYIDILLRWNARMNLTAVREPEEIVTRHFGESLFAARLLFPAECGTGSGPRPETHVVDVGSGAGFPGMPIKIWEPDVRVTLIESNYKKATFLREVARSLELPSVEAFQRRAEEFPGGSADVVTLRAVEKFETALPVAAKLVTSGGRLAILIGESQSSRAKELLPGMGWEPVSVVPNSTSRIVMIGVKEPGK